MLCATKHYVRFTLKRFYRQYGSLTLTSCIEIVFKYIMKLLNKNNLTYVHVVNSIYVMGEDYVVRLSILSFLLRESMIKIF